MSPLAGEYDRWRGAARYIFACERRAQSAASGVSSPESHAEEPDTEP